MAKGALWRHVQQCMCACILQKMLAAKQENEIEHFAKSGILCSDQGANC